MFVAIFIFNKSDINNFIKTSSYLFENNTIYIYYSDHNLLRNFLNLNNNYDFKIYFDKNIKNLKNLSLEHFKNSTEDIFLNIDTNIELTNLTFLNHLNDSTIIAPLILIKIHYFQFLGRC